MRVLNIALCVVGVLCLIIAPATGQQSLPRNPAISTEVPAVQPEDDILRAGFQRYDGPAGGPAIAWHNYRQHNFVGDIAPGLVFTWDIPLPQPIEETALTFRPGMSYLHPTFMIDAALRLQYRDYVAVIAGLSFDPTNEREFHYLEQSPEWIWVREQDRIGKRSFALLGIQVPTGFAYYEFLYRIQLEKGAHAYWTNSDKTFRWSTGYRRYFLLSVGMGIWL